LAYAKPTNIYKKCEMSELIMRRFNKIIRMQVYMVRVLQNIYDKFPKTVFKFTFTTINEFCLVFENTIYFGSIIYALNRLKYSVYSSVFVPPPVPI
jgi:hypothetical protein